MTAPGPLALMVIAAGALDAAAAASSDGAPRLLSLRDVDGCHAVAVAAHALVTPADCVTRRPSWVTDPAAPHVRSRHHAVLAWRTVVVGREAGALEVGVLVVSPPVAGPFASPAWLEGADRSGVPFGFGRMGQPSGSEKTAAPFAQALAPFLAPGFRATGPLGSRCADDADCDSRLCLAAAGGIWRCVRRCRSDAECDGLACRQGHCRATRDPGSLGSPCERDGQCDEFLCVAAAPGRTKVCARPCVASERCPDAFECLTLADARVGEACLERRRGVAGCAVATRSRGGAASAAGVAATIVVALSCARRRRRRGQRTGPSAGRANAAQRGCPKPHPPVRR